MPRYAIFGSDTKSTGMFGYFYKKYRHIPVLLQKVPACSGTFTKSTGAKVSRYESAQLCLFRLSGMYAIIHKLPLAISVIYSIGLISICCITFTVNDSEVVYCEHEHNLCLHFHFGRRDWPCSRRRLIVSYLWPLITYLRSDVKMTSLRCDGVISSIYHVSFFGTL